MKKLYTLCLALMCAAATSAQSDDAKGMFEFTDKAGNVIADGSVITRDEIDQNAIDDQINSGLYVKQNTSESGMLVYLGVDLSRLDNGTFQFCFPNGCQAVKSTGQYSSKRDVMENQSIMTEWMPTAYGQATATLSLHAVKKGGTASFPTYKELGTCSTVTVHFVYADPTGINDISSDAHATPTAFYTADGKRLPAMQKGLNIVRLSNGKTVKVMK